MEVLYPQLTFDLQRDAFYVWLRWVAMERPLSPLDPPNQGIRVEVQLNRNAILGPTIVTRQELSEPLFLRTQQERTRNVLRAAARKGLIDLQLIVHGSVAHAPYAAIYHVRDAGLEAISRGPLVGTPLIQLQPSTPPDRWHVAGQVSLRLGLTLVGHRVRLEVLRG